MIHKCVITGCPNSSDTIIHYILPEEPNRRSLWLQFIERSEGGGGSVPASSRVCGAHFPQDCFTEVDLGFTMQLILNVDAVPTIYPGDRTSKDGDEALAAVEENSVEETCDITISSTVSLACVKEEPTEYEVTPVRKLLEDSKCSSATHVKQENNYSALSDEMCIQGSDQLKIIQSEDIKSETGCELVVESEDKGKPFSCSKEGKTRTYDCSECGKGFALRAFLKAHQKLHENVESTLMYSCTLCPRRFRYKGSLTAHMRHHTTRVTYKCPVCDETYQFKAALCQHIKTFHAGHKLHCSICEKGFLRLEAFLKHMDRHVVVTPYYCSTCKVYQLTERGYLCHRRIHEQKRLQMLSAHNGPASAEDPQADSGEQPPAE
ncbi:uncharacterized protein LOC143519706 [Brachyhypopomus gauderio]|uniref:uncharacterized protein LOC143519706 n=1 Tax=Brachyhypopomus gauderio TaxID=698409 RepID=UPI0040425D0D